VSSTSRVASASLAPPSIASARPCSSVRQERREAAAAQLVRGVEQILAQPAEGHLEEHPAAPRGAVGDGD
jgi:hypothetical protein